MRHKGDAAHTWHEPPAVTRGDWLVGWFWMLWTVSVGNCASSLGSTAHHSCRCAHANVHCTMIDTKHLSPADPHIREETAARLVHPDVFSYFSYHWLIL